MLKGSLKYCPNNKDAAYFCTTDFCLNSSIHCNDQSCQNCLEHQNCTKVSLPNLLKRIQRKRNLYAALCQKTIDECDKAIKLMTIQKQSLLNTIAQIKFIQLTDFQRRILKMIDEAKYDEINSYIVRHVDQSLQQLEREQEAMQKHMLKSLKYEDEIHSLIEKIRQFANFKPKIETQQIRNSQLKSASISENKKKETIPYKPPQKKHKNHTVEIISNDQYYDEIGAKIVNNINKDVQKKKKKLNEKVKQQQW